MGTQSLSPLPELLAAHRFQDAPPPGLYPATDTVCSCGASPALTQMTEANDFEWWVNHVTAHSEGRTHPNEWLRTPNGWEKVG